MFDIGFIEMLVVGLILLLVVGPERLPEVARTVGGWVHQAKQYLDGMKSELDRDLQLSELQRETRESFQQTRQSMDDLDRETRKSTDLSREPQEGQSDRSEDSAATGENVAADQPGDAGGEPGGPAAEPREEGPDPEEEAAADMERELNQDQPEDDKDRG